MNEELEQTQPQEPTFDTPPPNLMDTLSDIDVTRSFGEAKVTLKPFSALDGWELKRQYRDYLASDDPNFRQHYTIAVLANTTIFANQHDMPLNNIATINEQLENWQNVEKVFLAALNFNGIKTDPAEVERMRWQTAGEDVAKGFLAAVNDLMGPALRLAAENNVAVNATVQGAIDAT